MSLGGAVRGRTKEIAMPKKKDLKRLARSRMKKTGESYTAARAQLIKKKTTGAPDASKDKNLAERAGMSDSAVQKATGRTWKQWVTALDAIDAAQRPHKEVARWVHEEHGVDGWWAQTVTVGYERIRGLRQVGQRRSGSWEGSKSKTFPVPVAELYRAWSDEEIRARWLPEPIAVRTATESRSMRLDWPDGTLVSFWFTAKGDDKSSVQVQHTGLASKAQVEERKMLWGERLTALAEVLKA